MILAAWTLALAVATPAPRAEDCALTDHRCKGARSERRAATAPTPDQRALYLLSAHRSYLFLFEKTGDLHDLCTARRAFDASLAVAGQSAEQRASTEELRAELVAHERRYRPRCTHPRPRRADKRDAPRVAARATPARPDLPPADPPPPRTDLRPAGPTAQNASSPAPTVPAPSLAARPPLPANRPPPARVDDPRTGRGLLIAGGVTLGVGVAFTVAAAVLGHRMSETRRTYYALYDALPPLARPEEEARGEALLADYRALLNPTIALAISGGAAVVVAAVLTGVGGRRMTRTTSRATVALLPGGLAFRARF
jgi:hypothetical protein